MTSTYDPGAAAYLDEVDVRNEMSRVFDVCQSCRRCVDYCGVFPTLFEMLDRSGGGDAGRLTPDEQDRVIDGCLHCTRCATDCPYTPDRHEWNIDVPRLVLRATAMRHETGQLPLRRLRTAWFLARWWRLGPLSRAPAASFRRRLLSALAGVSARRRLPSTSGRSFSSWFRSHRPDPVDRPRGAVSVFPGCLVEHAATGVGNDLVRVYQRNRIECSVSEVGCCGAPRLHAGDVGRFRKIAGRVVEHLAAEVRAGREVVVPEPMCGYALRHEYPVYLAGTARHDDAELVARHTFDAAEYLMRMHARGGLDTDFTAADDAAITYYVSSHHGAEDSGSAGSDLMALTGVEVAVLDDGSTDAGPWGLRAEHDDAGSAATAKLVDQLARAGSGRIVGDSQLVNLAIEDQAGVVVEHPLSIVARAYGVSHDSR